LTVIDGLIAVAIAVWATMAFTVIAFMWLRHRGRTRLPIEPFARVARWATWACWILVASLFIHEILVVVTHEPGFSPLLDIVWLAGVALPIRIAFATLATWARQDAGKDT
jgi:hypothetical protein